MDVAWEDSGVGSFLDSSGTGAGSFASFASDGSALWWSSSSDSPVFSGQPVLWESGADTPSDSHISAFTADSGTGTDTGAGGWIADAGSGLAGGSLALNDNILWTGTGSDTSSSLASNGGVGLGALDLGVSSGASQWQQFADLFAGQSATGLADVPQLLWTGAASQPQVTVPVLGGLQSLQAAASDGLPLPTAGILAPTQLMWTQPSGATGLTAGPSLTDAAPTPGLSGAGIGNLVPPLNGPVLSGAGTHS
jgi:hypothetical protein